MLASLIAALVAALFYGIAAVMQAMAVHEASNRPPHPRAGGVDPVSYTHLTLPTICSV